MNVAGEALRPGEDDAVDELILGIMELMKRPLIVFTLSELAGDRDHVVSILAVVVAINP